MPQSFAAMEDSTTSFQFLAPDSAPEVGHATIFENLPLTPPRSFTQDGNFAENSFVPAVSYSHKGSRSFNFPRTAPFPLSPLGQAPSPPDSLNTTLASVPNLPPDSESDRKAAFRRHSSFTYAAKDASQGPFLSRNVSYLSQHAKSLRALNRIVSMDRGQTPQVFSAEEDMWKGHFVMTDVETSTLSASNVEIPHKSNQRSVWLWDFVIRMTKAAISGNRATRRLLLLIMLNVAYSSVELFVGLLSGRVGLVSDAFHLTFGCGLLSFSLIAMNFAKTMHDDVYTYGYKRLEVLAAFTNALFLLFLSFSLAVEALHAFIQDESEHKHYLIISAATNLLVNVLGVWFFRSYARIRIVYRKAEDMNHHSIFLHVLSDSIRSAGLILASWLLTLGVKNAETLCLGLVAITVFLVVMPLFKATAGILLQMAPTGISVSAFNKCLRQVTMLEDVLECCQPRFWEMVPGFVVGTLALRVRKGADEQRVLKYVHCVYNDIGIKDLTVQIDVEL